jgi:UDP-glucuronate 4-epimerase
MNKNILITGAAGFIGMHTAHKLIQNNFNVFGIDNLNDYYDPELKKSRLAILEKYEIFFSKKTKK